MNSSCPSSRKMDLSWLPIILKSMFGMVYFYRITPVLNSVLNNFLFISGIYCLLVVSSMLNILTHELVEGTPEFIASCQTYEGGFSSSSHPFSHPSLLSSSPRFPPLGEAHGGYTFCALASWVLLQPYLALYRTTMSSTPSIDLKNLLRWLTQMQGTEIELGGFKGRTNKLVDGCYSWWCGGSFALLEALGVGGIQNADPEEVPIDPSDESWVDIDSMQTKLIFGVCLTYFHLF